MSACVLFQNTKMWDGEVTKPVEWHVHRDERWHLELGDRVFFSRTKLEVGIFAAGTVAEPPPGSKIMPPSLVVFESKFIDGKITPHINVQVDIPPSPVPSANPPQCSRDYPVLLPESALMVPKRRNGVRIPLGVSVEDLCESLRQAWEKSTR